MRPGHEDSTDFFVSEEKVAARSLVSAYLNLGFKCINNCLFCAVKDVSSVEMNPKTALAAISYCSERGCRTLTISGGEPTIRSDFLEIAKCANSLGLEIILQTNARLLSDPLFCEKTIAAGIFDFYVSLHGSDKEIHEQLTRREGSFEETVQGIKNLFQFGATVDTNFVITNANCHDMTEYSRWLLSEIDGIATAYFTYPTPVGNAHRFSRVILPSFPSIKRVVSETAEVFKASNKRFSFVDIPLCIYDPKGSEAFLERPVMPYGLYLEPKGARWSSSVETGKPFHPQICNDCCRKLQCCGVYHTYIALHSDRGLCPFLF